MGSRTQTPTAERAYALVLHWARRLRDVDRELGVTPARFSALAALAFRGSMSVTELAAFERTKPPAASRLVADMEAAGLVRRSGHPEDGRSVRIEISAAGRRLVERVRRRKIALFERHLALLEPAERALATRTVGLLEPPRDG
jgi:DNA-binding MarR family transcriptional regulator